MPKYYRDKILSQEMKDKQIVIIKDAMEKEEERRKKLHEKYSINTAEKDILAKEYRIKLLKRSQNRTVD